jgi:hypothetical protein
MSPSPCQVDFPREAESVSSPRYTVRVHAPEARLVEVRLDSGDWKPCRHVGDYWWCDCEGYREGAHLVRARMFASDGHLAISPSKSFEVHARA